MFLNDFDESYQRLIFDEGREFRKSKVQVLLFRLLLTARARERRFKILKLL